MAAVAVDGTAAVPVSAATGTGRSVLVYNAGPNTVYFGETSSVTSASGVPFALGAYMTIGMGEANVFYARCATSETAELRTMAGVT